MKILFLLLALSLAFVGSIVAATSKGAERFLWGSLFLSVGLGLAVTLAGASYLGALTVLAFLASDLIIYLFYNSLDLREETSIENKKAERFFKIFLIWALSYIAVLGVIKIFAVEDTITLYPMSDSFKGIQQLQEIIWDHGWVIVLIAMLSMIVMAVGGFMLVRKEK